MAQEIKEYKLPPGQDYVVFKDAELITMHEACHVDDICFLLSTSGGAVIEIDMQTCEVPPHSEITLLPSSLIRIISVSPDFRISGFICSQRFIFNMNMRHEPDFFKFLKFNPVVDVRDDIFEIALKFYDLLNFAYSTPQSKHAEEKMRSLIRFCLLTMGELTVNHWANVRTEQTERQADLFHQFIMLVRENATDHHDVEWYADKMAITPRYLSQLCKGKMLKPKAMIDETLINSAKEMLHSTDMTVQAIAAKLNFADQSIFARFFKRKVGESPVEWRRRVR